LLVPANKLRDPQFWLFRSEEIRTIAGDMKVGEAKTIMMRIAEDYERMAKLVEEGLAELK
jgi:hypothetical protein